MSKTFYLAQAENSFGTFVTCGRYRSRKPAEKLAKCFNRGRVITLAELRKERASR